MRSPSSAPLASGASAAPSAALASDPAGAASPDAQSAPCVASLDMPFPTASGAGEAPKAAEGVAGGTAREDAWTKIPAGLGDADRTFLPSLRVGRRPGRFLCQCFISSADT